MDISFILNNAVSISVLLGAIWGILHYIISNFTKPLISEMSRLSASITEFATTLKLMDERQHEEERRLVIAEQTVKRLHERLDETNKRVGNMEDHISKHDLEYDVIINKMEQKLEYFEGRMNRMDTRLGVFGRFCDHEHDGDMSREVLETICNPHCPNAPKRYMDMDVTKKRDEN